MAAVLQRMTIGYAQASVTMFADTGHQRQAPTHLLAPFFPVEPAAPPTQSTASSHAGKPSKQAAALELPTLTRDDIHSLMHANFHTRVPGYNTAEKVRIELPALVDALPLVSPPSDRPARQSPREQAAAPPPQASGARSRPSAPSRPQPAKPSPRARFAIVDASASGVAPTRVRAEEGRPHEGRPKPPPPKRKGLPQRTQPPPPPIRQAQTRSTDLEPSPAQGDEAAVTGAADAAHADDGQVDVRSRALTPRMAMGQQAAPPVDDSGDAEVGVDGARGAHGELSSSAEEMPLEEADAISQAVAMLRAVPPFARLPEAKLRALVEGGRQRTFPRYATIFREGSRSTSFVLVLRGQVYPHSYTSDRLHAPDLPPSPVGGKSGAETNVAGAYFGVEALGFGECRRDSALEAMEDTTVLLLGQDDLHSNSIRLFDFRVHVVARLLSERPYFKHLTGAQYAQLSKLVEIRYSDGDLYKQGDEAEDFYILLEGRVQQRRRQLLTGWRVGGQELVGEYSANGAAPWFGEVEVGNGDLRRETAGCVEPSKFFVVPKHFFKKFLDASPGFAEKIDQRYKSKAERDAGGGRKPTLKERRGSLLRLAVKQGAEQKSANALMLAAVGPNLK